MIYLFSGDDAKSKRASYEKFMQSLPAGIGIFPVSRNSFDQAELESLYSGSSLFSALSAAVFENTFEHEETRDFILEKLKLMAQSPNSFIFLEGKLNKPVLD